MGVWESDRGGGTSHATGTCALRRAVRSDRVFVMRHRLLIPTTARGTDKFPTLPVEIEIEKYY